MAKCILTVDDAESVRQLVSFTLSNEGYKVLEAKDGKEAVNKLASKNVDMVVTDLNMPEMDGINLIKHIRSLTKYKFIPIIMLTTESQTGKKQEGKAAGATGWMVKPFQPAQLVNVVKKVLK